MHLALRFGETNQTAKVWKTKSFAQTSSVYAVEEINAYIAIRDDLFAEAEQMRTRTKLDSVTVANDFVASCLAPARPPYGSQTLAEMEAARERKRCDAVRNRVAELRRTALAQQVA